MYRHFVHCVFALSAFSILRLIHATASAGSTALEWTALGDSYAVGAGTGTDLGWGRCLRFSSSYPEMIFHSSRPSILGAPDDRILNFPACSGATTADILAHQFDDTATWNWEYGERPSFGDPSFATLTAGGDDIDFVNLVRNCIYDILPWRTCDAQRKASRKMIEDPKLVDNLDQVIKAAVAAGRKGSAGDDFRLFVTSYARFFNAETTQCNNVTWSILPEPFGNRQLLTQEMRRDLNDMTDLLNGAIETAVARNNGSNVYYIDWTTNHMDTHRYCEPTNTEPCDNDICTTTWFWQYPSASSYGTPNTHQIGPLRESEETFKDHLAQLWDSSVRDFKELLTKSSAGRLPDVPEALHEAHKWVEGLQNLTEGDTGSRDERGLKFPGWLVERVRVFHPREKAHRVIAGLIGEKLVETQPVGAGGGRSEL